MKSRFLILLSVPLLVILTTTLLTYQVFSYSREQAGTNGPGFKGAAL